MDWMEREQNRRITGRVIGLVLLVAVLMLGIGFSIGRRSGDDRDERDYITEVVGEAPRRFEDIEYIRPYIAALENKVKAAEQLMADGGDLETIEAALDECYEQYYNYDTMYTVAYIRARQDMTDSYYADELAWGEDNYPRVQQLMEELCTRRRPRTRRGSWRRIISGTALPRTMPTTQTASTGRR